MHRLPIAATVRRAVRVVAAIAAISVTTTAANAQARRTVTVVGFATGLPLANAEIVNRASGEALLTNALGEVTLPVRWPALVPVRIRQIGYIFVDTTITPGDSLPVSIVLKRVAYSLSAVGVADTTCNTKPEPAAARLAATAIEQLQMAAERYNTFKKQFPFRAHLERTTRYSATQRRVTKSALTQRQVPREATEKEVVSSDDWGERYDPRRIVDDGGLSLSIQILFLAHLADPVFWRRHCFEVERIATLAGRPTVKLRFAPVENISGPEWEGWAFLDSATSELRRLEFRLARIPEGTRPYRLEGYTTFMSPTPSIVLPESTVAVWWRRKPVSDSLPPDILQILRLARVQYRGPTP